MSYLNNSEIKQKDSILKKSLILSKNYKNQYIKKKKMQLNNNIRRISPKKGRFKGKRKCKSPKEKQKKTYRANKTFNNDIFNGKNGEINGGENTHKFSDFNFTNYDKSNNDILNYNIYSENTDINNNNNKRHIYANGMDKSKFLKINLKKYINANPHNYMNNINKKDYFLLEKKLQKVNIKELNKILSYLKLNKAKPHSHSKNKNIELNYIKSHTINFFIENKYQKLITFPNELKTFNNELLTEEIREQFSMEKTKNRKFNDLEEEDNIFINYFPSEKERTNKCKNNSNNIENIIINLKEKDKKIGQEIKEIVIINPKINPIKSNENIHNSSNKDFNIFINKDLKEKKDINKEKNINNNSRQFIKFKEKLKKKLEDESNKKNDKCKISVKIINMALGLENHMKNNEIKNDANNREENEKENGNKLNEEKIKEKMPIIYKKKKRTKIVFDDKQIFNYYFYVILCDINNYNNIIFSITGINYL